MSDLALFSHRYGKNDYLIELNIHLQKLYIDENKIKKEYVDIRKKIENLPSPVVYLVEEDYKRRLSLIKKLINDCKYEIQNNSQNKKE